MSVSNFGSDTYSENTLFVYDCSKVSQIDSKSSKVYDETLSDGYIQDGSRSFEQNVCFYSIFIVCMDYSVVII